MSSSLKERAAKAEKEKNKKFQIPNGEYQAKIIDWELGASRTGNSQFVLEMKLAKNISKEDPEDEIWEDFVCKGKKIKAYFGLDEDWKWKPLYDLLKSIGMDVDSLEEPEDMENTLEELEDLGYTKVTVKIENTTMKNGKSFRAVEILDGQVVKQPEKDSEEESEPPKRTRRTGKVKSPEDD